MRSLFSICLVASCVPAALASAQEGPSDAAIEEARVAFVAGEAAYAEGHFDDALQHFQRAYELTANPDILYNVATVADRARQDQVALDAYRGYLAARPQAPDAEHVAGRIDVLERQIREADARAARSREAQAREEQLRLDAADARAGEEAARRREDEARRSAGGDDPGAAPWVLLDAGAAVVVVGVVLLVVALNDVAAVESPSAPMPRWADVADANERAPILSTIGAIAIGVGAASAIGGLVWELAAGSPGGGEDVAVALGPSGASVRGHF
jgi:tetratricopeptide (TPR) repeat protein